MPSLTLETILTPSSFSDIGRPTLGLRSAAHNVVALCSEFDLLYWPGRAIYEGHKLRHRLSLYSADLSNRIALFDSSRFPINDVAFHPTLPVVAIGTGTYDGGYSFEGELWLWNYRTGEHASLLGESREVAACRFLNQSDIALLLRPRYEDEYPGPDPFNTFVGLTIDIYERDGRRPDPRLANLTPCNPVSLGFESPPRSTEASRLLFDEIIRANSSFEERTRIWDIEWLSDSKIVAVHDNCFYEIWDSDGRRIHRHVGDGHGIQVFSSPNGNLINVIHPGDDICRRGEYSALYQVSNEFCSKVIGFDHPVSASCDRRGNLFCRDTGCLTERHNRRDCLLNSCFEKTYENDLGHYDCFNHYLRIDDNDHLYFLRGTPPENHKDKVLCRIAHNGIVEPLMNWDNRPNHLMCGTACLAADDSVIRAYYVHDPRPGQGTKQIDRCDIVTGKPYWTITLDALITSMELVSSDLLFCALTNGDIGLINIRNGTIVFMKRADVYRAPTVVLSSAVRGFIIAAGTIDGNILMYRWNK